MRLLLPVILAVGLLAGCSSGGVKNIFKPGDRTTDVNFVSFAGNDTGLVIRKYWNETGGGEVIFPDEPWDGTMRVIEIDSLAVPPGVTIADLLKCSHIRGVRFNIRSLDGRGAKEDARDVLACAFLEFNIGELWAAEKFCGTTKGQSTNIRDVVQFQYSSGGEVDWDYGNRVDSNQPQGRTTACSINIVAHTPGYKPKIRVLHAHVPTMENGDSNYEVDDRAAGWYGTIPD